MATSKGKGGRPKKTTPTKRLRAVYMTDADYAACVGAAAPLEFSPWAAAILADAAHRKGRAR